MKVHYKNRKARNLFTVSCALISAFALQSSVLANNILLIVVDDLGLESFPAYGIQPDNDYPSTPTMDAMASQGILFNNTWVHPSCSPTRAAILTGRHAFRTGVGFAIADDNNNNTPAFQQAILGSSEITIPNILNQANYNCGIVGKWHLSEGINYPTRLGYGFDSFSGIMSGALANYCNWPKLETTSGGSVSQNTVTTYATTENINDTIDFIQDHETQNPNDPWFMYLALKAPHTPLHVPVPRMDLIQTPALRYLPGTCGSINLVGPVTQRDYFKAMIEALDTELGNLLPELDLSDTTVFLIGDNGSTFDVTTDPFILYTNEDPGDPENVTLEFRSKGTLYEGGIRVPFLAFGNMVASTPNGRVVDDLISGVDLFPTILNIAGVSSAQINQITDTDGVSFLPLLKDEPYVGRNYIFSEQFIQDPNKQEYFENTGARMGKAIRNEGYKLIVFDPPIGATQVEYEFYDLASDPFEEIDLLTNNQPLTSVEQANLVALNNALNALLATAQP